jgi:putative membrane protein
MVWKNLVCAGVLSLALGASGAAMAQQTDKDVKDQKTAAKEHQKADKEVAKDVNKKPKDTNKGEKGLDRDRKAAQNKLEHADTSFMKKVAENTKAELELAQLAEQKAGDPQVKEFAQKIVADHQKADEKLKALAQQENVDLPDRKPMDESTEKGRLNRLSGADFDRAYMKHMVAEHEQDINDFRKEATNSKDDNVRKFASENLPVLQAHLKMARDLNAKVNGNPEKGSTKANKAQKQSYRK